MAERWAIAPVVNGRAEWADGEAMRLLRKLHKPPREERIRPYNCVHDGWPWPCPTIRALDREQP